MDSNTHSNPPPEPPEYPAGRADRLGSLPGAVDELAAEELDRLTDAALTEEVLALRRLVDRLEGQWLRRVAAVDARGAAGADRGEQALPSAGWLRNRLRLGAGTARSAVRTARTLFRGPLTRTATALTSGQISPAHARVLADGTHDLPEHVAMEAEPVLLEAAGRLDPPLLRQAVGYLRQVADPDGADRDRERRHERRRVWLSPTFDNMVAIDGLLEPEAGQIVLAALEPLARPADADDSRDGGQRNADALAELARRALEDDKLPKVGGVRPQLLVTVDHETLLGPGGLGGEAGWAGPLDPEACRRLACDGAVTRVLVARRHPDGHQPVADHPGHGPTAGGGVNADPCEAAELQGRLQAAMALLPPVLGGPPSLPLDVGRATRVVQPAQRSALTVRDGGCVFPGCERPLAWCEAHHLWHWVHGGPTDLANLALLCRTHHRAVHEGGWRLARGPDGRFAATPPHRRHRPAA